MQKKLRYVPGLISLIGLPILIFIFPVEDPAEKVVISLRIPAPTSLNNPELPFTEQFVQSHLRQKKITRIYLHNERIAEDEVYKYQQNEKFNFISKEMQRLGFIGDTTISLQVEFGPRNTYEEWIKLQNLAILFDVRRYAFIDNSFYFFSNPPEEVASLVSLPDIAFENSFTADMEEYIPPTKWELSLQNISWRWGRLMFIINDNLQIVIPFFFLIFLPWIFWLKNRISKVSFR